MRAKEKTRWSEERGGECERVCMYVFIPKSGDLLTKLGVEKAKNLDTRFVMDIAFLYDDSALAHAAHIPYGKLGALTVCIGIMHRTWLRRASGLGMGK